MTINLNLSGRCHFVARALFILFFAFSANSLSAQFTCPPSLVFQKVTSNIHPLVGGFVWKKPSDYDANPTKYYPTIIYFPGVGSVGSGSSTDLCSIFADASLPLAIQNGGAILTVTYGGQNYEFMVFCPQYRQYSYSPGMGDISYPSAGTAAAVLNHVVANYRVDVNRIYMSGMSAGANIAMEYAAASTANANTLAGLTPVALCAINIVGGGNISATNLPVWIHHCNNDINCSPTVSSGWVSAINAGAPNPLAKLTLMPVAGGACNDGWGHNAWPLAYSSSYSVDGMNMFNWMIQYSRNATVPVAMKSFQAQLRSGKVVLDWSTSSEIDADHFLIERAGADQRYEVIGKKAASGRQNFQTDYAFTDASVLNGVSYYRLVQVDIDGNKTILPVKRIWNNSGKVGFAVFPNPVAEEATAYIHLAAAQKITVTVTDLNGKQLITHSAFYNEGNSSITLPFAKLPKGVYILRAHGDQFNEMQKIVKQ